ncbi:MAG TPA: hypothetical protein VEB86_07935 [Chryseosolibacter sp.]|nr:hypothetical protein [Chryseosolibacter sp.]
MRKLLLASFFFSSLASLHAQDALFFDDFDNGGTTWNEVKKEDHERFVEGGKLHMNVASKTYFYAGQNIVPDKKQDFSIETEFTFSKYKSGEAGIMWGGGEKGEKMYFFLLSPLGAWNFGVWSPQFYSLTGSQKSSLVNKGLAINKLKIERIGNKLKLYVNDVEVHTTKFPSTKGQLMGLVSGGGIHSVEAEYFKVTKLTSQ